MKKVLFVIFLMLIISFSGCVTNTTEQVPPTVVVSPQTSPTPTVSPVPTKIPQSAEQNKINELENKMNELENKIKSLQQQTNDLQIIIKRLGLPKPSNRSLIPTPSFRLEVTFAEMQGATSWIFKDTGQVAIREPGTETVYTSYTSFPNNNTIQIRPTGKYDIYGLVLYDDYITAIYENGWIAWVKKYRISQKYNPLTQKYEAD